MPTKKKTSSATVKKSPVKSQEISSEKIVDENVTVTKIISKLSQQFNLLTLIIIALFLFQTYTFYKLYNLEKNGSAGTQAAQPTKQVEVKIDDIKKLFAKDFIHFGDDKKKVLFVEFSDPSCPYCHIAGGKNLELNQSAGQQFVTVEQGGTYVPPVPEMRKLVDEGKASYSFIYRNGHGNGVLTSQALYCAHEKGSFWEAHDLLMSSAGYTLINDTVQNDKKNIPQLVDFLKGSVDSGFLTECLEDEKYAKLVQRDTQVGDKMGVGGTPGFFVNTTSFAGAYSYTEMKAVVDKAI